MMSATSARWFSSHCSFPSLRRWAIHRLL